MQQLYGELPARYVCDADDYALRTLIVEGSPLCVPCEPLANGFFYANAKRAADIAIASGAILVLSPLMLITMALICLDDPGPVIYRQKRVGRCGEPFNFYKFRSMHIHADKVRKELHSQNEANGVHFKIKNDPRMTRVGKWLRKTSIDELPQLFSVLAGTMSIVGPRPHLPCEVTHYVTPQEQRLLVKPGLLCLREIRGRSDLGFDEWVRSDLEYISKRSLWLDLKIFLSAFPAVISGRGAH